GCAVVPEVKYSSSGSPARVTPEGTNETDEANAKEYECQPGTPTPDTTTRVQAPGSPANLSAEAASATTCRTDPRTSRSARSAGCSRVEAGMITAPSFIAARMTSHSGATLPSMSSTRSPRLTPSPRSQFATCAERPASAPYDRLTSVRPSGPPSESETIRSAGRSGCSAAITSNQSSAQLNSSSSGHANSRRAAA